jgi:hypothetical protein
MGGKNHAINGLAFELGNRPGKHSVGHEIGNDVGSVNQLKAGHPPSSEGD